MGKYQKNMKNIFDILMEKGSPKLAIRYAKRIIKDGQGRMPSEIAPGTKVYELVEELAKYLPEDIQKVIGYADVCDHVNRKPDTREGDFTRCSVMR